MSSTCFFAYEQFFFKMLEIRHFFSHFWLKKALAEKVFKK